MIIKYIVELRPGEITLLRRALAITRDVYGRFYQDSMIEAAPQLERENLQQKIAAFDKLSDRLLHDVKLAETVSQAVIDRVIAELKAYDEDNFPDNAAGWEKATETIVKSLIK